jgi:hypothetical protein
MGQSKEVGEVRKWDMYEKKKKDKGTKGIHGYRKTIKESPLEF